MKNLKSISVVLVIFFLSISCSSDSDGSNSSPLQSYFFNAKINGNSFSATVPEFGASKSGNVITIACVQGIHKFQLKITNPIGNGVGTYTIPATTAGTAIMTYEDDTTVYTCGNCSTTGTLIISSIENNEISGTFSYSGQKSGTCPQPQKNITEGSFKAIYSGS